MFKAGGWSVAVSVFNIKAMQCLVCAFLREKTNLSPVSGIGKFGLVIPWVVLQELDNLKKGRILANVSQKAIPAVQFIHTCLKDQDSKLWGQSLQLASQQPCKL